jgi:hypothetical protein
MEGTTLIRKSSDNCIADVRIERITQKQEKKEETLTQQMKRSPGERHTQTHGSLTETFG